jgi:hypothetical protein
MRVHARSWLMALVCGVLLAAILPAGAQAFGIKEFVAVNCKEAFPECASTGAPFFFPKAPTEAESKLQGETQAGARVPFGVTTFKVDTEGAPGHEYPAGLVKENATHEFPIVDPTKIPDFIRTDVAPGLATNPFAPEQCSVTEFNGVAGEVAEGAFLAPECKPGSEIGINHVVVYLPEAAGGGPEGADAPLEGTVYNLTPGEGKWASKFGVAVSLAPLGDAGAFAHTIINGNVEWGKQARGTNLGDFHDYFEIEVSPKLPLVASRLSFFGNVGKAGKAGKGQGDFITNATRCGNQANLVTRLAMKDVGGETVTKNYIPPEHIELEGCGALQFPVNFALTPATSVTEQPNEFGATASEEHEPNKTDVSQVRSASFTLPDGMTLNPSAAKGLTACTEAQAHQDGTVFDEAFGVECAASSKIGTVTLEVPTLPPGSLKGDVYLGSPNSGTITGPPYKIYVVANNPSFGLSVRLLGETIPDPVDGQVTTFFKNPPEQPFTSLALKFERGVLAPVANPLLCGNATGSANFEPTSAPGTTHTDAFGLMITGCASATPPFNPAQSTVDSNGNGGASTSFTLNLARNDGEQYVGSVKTVLPPGLVGKLPLAERCSAAAAESETVACPAGSQIGTATVLAGSGPSPFSFSGPVYLTNSVKGAPYGLSIKVPAIAGPFNLGTVVTVATINVNPLTSQVIVESTLPKIRSGIPLRIRSISVAVNKSGFMINPTNCAKLETVSTLGGYATLDGGATASKSLATPFQVANCSALKFTPKFKASTSSKTSRVNGASLTTTITQAAGQANIKSVKVQLPRSLPSRLTTLQKACPEAVFANNPYSCGSGAFVGGATVKTPTLPQPLKGAAILVSHAGASFPDLDLVVEDPNHLRVILVGNTNIKNGITTTTFATTPDVPVSSVTVNLPVGSHSAVAAFGNLCTKPQVMPTTITAQNGKTIKQNTIISVAGCGVRIVGHKVVGNTAFITVQTFAAGRISGSGAGLRTVYKRLNRAFKTVSLQVPLSSGGRNRHKPLKLKLRVGFVPKAKGGARSASSTKVTFR